MNLKYLKWCIMWGTICFITYGCTQNGDDHEGSPENNITKKNDSTIFKFVMQPFTNSNEDQLAAYGQKLVNETYNYFYKNGRKVGNQLTCSNCHLNGGTKAYGIPYIGLTKVFPTYIGRENRLVSLKERINGCFERSMNGEAIPEDSKEMNAIVAYINFLGKDVTDSGRIIGQGTLALTPPDRAADTLKGAVVYQNKCAVCHQKDGQGIPLPKGKGFIYPPLWGSESYNDGAGMGRVLTAAKFIKGNMPFGATYHTPQVTDEEAYDVAAYINSFARPVKANKEADYPDRSKKPKDCPYPPYADTIPQIQHKYGPFNF